MRSECCRGRTKPAIQQISFLSCLSGCWLKQHNFFSWLFWTDLPFCCPDSIFAFKCCSCGLRIIGAFLFFLWHLCSAVSVCTQLGWEIRAGLPWSWLAQCSTSFPTQELSKKTGSCSAPGISCDAVLSWNCCVFLHKLWCLFLAKPHFSLAHFILSVLVDRRAAGRPGTKYWSLNSLYVSFGRRFALFGWHHPVVCDSL